MALGTPIIALAAVTGLDLDLSAMVGGGFRSFRSSCRSG
jgi:hypothetical protein